MLTPEIMTESLQEVPPAASNLVRLLSLPDPLPTSSQPASHKTNQNKSSTRRSEEKSPRLSDGVERGKDGREADDGEGTSRNGRSSKRAASNSPDGERARQHVSRERHPTSRSPPRMCASVVGASRVAISYAYSYAFVIRPQCVDIIPLLDGEAVGPSVGEEDVGLPLSAVNVRVPGRSSCV